MALFTIHFLKDDGDIVQHPARRYAEGTRLRHVIADASRYFADRRFVVEDDNKTIWFQHQPEHHESDTQPAVFR